MRNTPAVAVLKKGRPAAFTSTMTALGSCPVRELLNNELIDSLPEESVDNMLAYLDQVKDWLNYEQP